MFRKTILSIATGLFSVAGLSAQNQSTMKNINNQAPVKCSISIKIKANQQKVWSVLTSINNWASWQTDISSAKLNGQLQPNATFDWKSGGAKIHSTLQTVNTNSQIGWTGKALGIYAVHNWTLYEHDGITEVQVDESMEGLFASLLKRSINKSLEKGLQNWLQLLKNECEKA